MKRDGYVSGCGGDGGKPAVGIPILGGSQSSALVEK